MTELNIYSKYIDKRINDIAKNIAKKYCGRKGPIISLSTFFNLLYKI